MNYIPAYLKSTWPLLFLIYLTLSCASKIDVQTDPLGVEVFAYSASGDKHLLGTTPFELAFTDIEKWNSLSSLTGSLIALSFEKKEFETQNFLLPPSRAGLVRASLFIKMKTGKEEARLASALLQNLHNAQKYATGGNFELAHQEVDKALLREPTFIRGLSMKAALFYVQKNWAESLKWYNKALDLDPQFEEAIQYINEIQNQKAVVR